METNNINMEDKVKLPEHIQTPDQIYQWVHKYTELFRTNLLYNVMRAKGYTQNFPEGPWEKITPPINLEEDMNAKAKAFKEQAPEREAKKILSKKFGKL
jgi:hypothetical protein